MICTIISDREDTANLLSYHVTVLTGDVRGAGTDANVFLVMIGKTGKSREIVLDDEKNNFERGMTDEFKVSKFTKQLLCSVLSL